jgi:hypothetical protein
MILLAGAAALAISMPAAAEKGGKGGGNGHSGGKGQAAQVDHGGGKGRAGKPDKAQRNASRADRRDDRRFDDRGRGRKIERRSAQRVERGRDRSDDRRSFVDRRDRADPIRVRTAAPRFAGFDNACPPGLAKKNNGCLPPGQAKKLYRMGQRVDRSWYNGYALPAGYQNLYYDTPDYYYRYDNFGNIYRVDARSNMISGLIPLVDGDFFAVGQQLPAGFDSYNLPPQYRDTWYDSDDAWYRYDDNAIYQVDPQSSMIESIVALLGGGLDVGQPLPAGYDAYNLPLDYRDDYVDGDDYLYRYGDGNIYQVDTKTQIVKAIVEMLV